ncbi:MAG: hypothetical protein Q9219_007131 [cf. Caloplaca sp. 3 TL-2023]
MGIILAQHHYQMDDDASLTQNADFISAKIAVVVGERNSETRAESIEKIRKKIQHPQNLQRAFFPHRVLVFVFVDQGITLRSDWLMVSYSNLETASTIMWPYLETRCSRGDSLPTIVCNRASEQRPTRRYAERQALKTGYALWSLAERGLLVGTSNIDAIYRYARYTMPNSQLVLPWFSVKGKSADGKH